MAETFFLAPDLEDGFIHNGIGQNNSWVTTIQSIMRVGVKSYENTFFLSHECRMEKVVFLEEEEASSIFRAHVNGQAGGRFLTYSHNGKYVSLEGPEEVAVRKYIVPIGQGDKKIQLPSTKDTFNSSVKCKERTAYIVPDLKVLESCHIEQININKLYFRLKTYIKAKDADRLPIEIFSPVRYLNYSNNPISGQISRYLQLISGDCLFPLISADFPSYGYIAAAKSISDAKQLIEVCFNVYSEIENPNLDSSKASLRHHGINELKGTVDFYRYE